MKILIATARAQTIPRVQEARKTLNYDRVEALHMFPSKAYAAIQKFFTEHKEYTHLVIAAGDLLVQPGNMKNLESVLRENDYPVICGVCNVGLGEDSTKCIVTKNLPHPMIQPILFRHYDWYKWTEVQDFQVRRVRFAGNCLACIRRDVLDIITLRTDAKVNGLEEGGNVDVMFAVDCEVQNIPIMADFNNRMLHLRDQEKYPVTRSLNFEQFIFIPAASQEIRG